MVCFKSCANSAKRRESNPKSAKDSLSLPINAYFWNSCSNGPPFSATGMDFWSSELIWLESTSSNRREERMCTSFVKKRCFIWLRMILPELVLEIVRAGIKTNWSTKIPKYCWTRWLISSVDASVFPVFNSAITTTFSRPFSSSAKATEHPLRRFLSCSTSNSMSWG